MTLKGSEVDAVPLNVPPPVFWTVKFLSAKLPRVTLPKSWELGVTEMTGAGTVVSTEPRPPVAVAKYDCQPEPRAGKEKEPNPKQRPDTPREEDHSLYSFRKCETAVHRRDDPTFPEEPQCRAARAPDSADAVSPARRSISSPARS